MGRRATIGDLARAAGVSVATVDRVLNGRHKVRTETAHRVLAAAEEIGFHATELIRLQIATGRPTRTFGFVLEREAYQYFNDLGRALEDAARAAPNVRAKSIIAYATDLTPHGIVATLRELAPNVDAIGILSIDDPVINQAIRDLKRQGKPTFAILSELSSPDCAGYVGIDSRKAGRFAAWTIARTARKPGDVAIMVASYRYIGDELREIGFRSYFREYAPDFRVVEAVTDLRDANHAAGATLDLLADNPKMVGIAAARGSEGVIAALRKQEERRPLTVVVNELTVTTRAALVDNVATLVISTPVERIARTVVGAMSRVLDGETASTPQQFVVPFEIFASENI